MPLIVNSGLCNHDATRATNVASELYHTHPPKPFRQRPSRDLFSPLENKKPMQQKVSIISYPHPLHHQESTGTPSPPGPDQPLPKETLPMANTPENSGPHRGDWKKYIPHPIPKLFVGVFLALVVAIGLSFFPAALSDLGASNELINRTLAVAEDYVGRTDATDWNALHY